jgi:serine O-acetyltransferase
VKQDSLFKIIKEDFFLPAKNDPALSSKFELLFNYPGVWAIINYRIAHYLYGKGLKLIARVIMGISQVLTNIDIHPEAKIGRRVFFDHAFGVVIGQTAVIGDDVLIYQGVTLGGVSLDRGVKRHPTIENGVVIGAGAKILGNILIGENSRIGSNSVVVKNVPKESTAVGIPARVITKGRDKNPLSHNKLPDINKELFIYLGKRIELLEKIIQDQNRDIELEKQDHELEQIYENFIKTLKD